MLQTRLSALVLLLLGLVGGAAPASAEDAAAARDERWRAVVAGLFEGRMPTETDGWISLTAPRRALDAALVPVTLSIPADRGIAGLYLVVDENPAPLAAHVLLGPAARAGELKLRIRVDHDTNLHAVAETTDGGLFAASWFIKAAGGCSAPGVEAPEVAMRSAGQMKLRVTRQDGAQRAEVLIRHPNFNGMQMDPITRYYTPARYLERIDIARDGVAVLGIEAGISLASDPAIGFALAEGGGTLTVIARDSKQAEWRQDFPLPIPGA